MHINAAHKYWSPSFLEFLKSCFACLSRIKIIPMQLFDHIFAIFICLTLQWLFQNFFIDGLCFFFVSLPQSSLQLPSKFFPTTESSEAAWWSSTPILAWEQRRLLYRKFVGVSGASWGAAFKCAYSWGHFWGSWDELAPNIPMISNFPWDSLRVICLVVQCPLCSRLRASCQVQS